MLKCSYSNISESDYLKICEQFCLSSEIREKLFIYSYDGEKNLFINSKVNYTVGKDKISVKTKYGEKINFWAYSLLFEKQVEYWLSIENIEVTQDIYKITYVTRRFSEKLNYPLYKGYFVVKKENDNFLLMKYKLKLYRK